MRKWGLEVPEKIFAKKYDNFIFKIGQIIIINKKVKTLAKKKKKKTKKKKKKR